MRSISDTYGWIQSCLNHAVSKEKSIFILVGALFLVILANSVMALPVFIGMVNNASDGTGSNDRTMVMTLTIDGTGEKVNFTDTIGENGESYTSQYYQIECWRDVDTLENCEPGDVVEFVVREEVDRYTTSKLSWEVSYDDSLVEMETTDLAKNIAPAIIIHHPTNGSTIAGMTPVNSSVYNRSAFPLSSVRYSISNSSGNYSKTGEFGSSLLSLGIQGYYNDTFNTSVFDNGNYTLFFIANNSLGETNISFISIEINNPRLPDLVINGSSISFDTAYYYEGQNVTITATIFNKGIGIAYDAIVQFFSGPLDDLHQLGPNQSVTINPGSSAEVMTSHIVAIGLNNITVRVDPPIATNGTIKEQDETNNQYSTSITLPLYALFVGNVTGMISLTTSSNIDIIKWALANTNDSNIFVADSDYTINFDSLSAFGIDKNNATRPGDFHQLDLIFGSENLTDSINRTFTYQGNPYHNETFIIFGREIKNVPTQNSTNSSKFMTGILWDSATDTNGYFDPEDKEPVVFITKVHQGTQGKYGIYDYEIRVPSLLMRYGNQESDFISIYAEIK